MPIFRTSAIGAATWAVATLALAQTSPVPIVAWPEIEAHTVGAPPIVEMDWVGQAHIEVWEGQLVVDTSGAVEGVQIASGPDSHREQALAAARTLRFIPFERDGRPVRALIPFTIQGRARDYSGPEDRSFPNSVDLNEVRIRLMRGACLGTCPIYELEIRGDGSVTYHAGAHTLILGDRRWSISEDRVRALLAEFRRADYFMLDGYYVLPVTDVPAYISSLEIGSRRKFVFDYGGAVRVPIPPIEFGHSGFVPAPPAVGDVEDAIDEMSGAQAFLVGTAETVPILRAEHFDFRSAEAAAALSFLARDCNVAVARAFLAEGAPASAADQDAPILNAVRCGDLEFLQSLIAAGGLAQPGAADGFLRESAASGSPQIVAEALRHSEGVNTVDPYGRTPLFYAASANAPQDDQPRPAHFDRASVVSLLLAAGADARRIDPHRNTALHSVRDGASARLLLQAGANARAINARGQTALFSQSSADVVHELLGAQVDPNVRDTYGQTALYSANSADVVRALVAGGASLTVVDHEGKTPLEGCNNEDVALALIEMGSPIPTGARFDALMARARPYRRRLMQALEERRP